MSYNYQLSEEAESDIEQGYLWYESKQEGLGEAFLESLDKAILLLIVYVIKRG